MPILSKNSNIPPASDLHALLYTAATSRSSRLQRTHSTQHSASALSPRRTHPPLTSRPVESRRPWLSRARSAAWQNPDHAGEQYNSLASTVDRKTSFIDAAGIPWLRSTRSAYSSREHDVNKLLTWSAAVLASILVKNALNTPVCELTCYPNIRTPKAGTQLAVVWGHATL